MRVECQDQTPAEHQHVCQSARGFAPITTPPPPVGAAHTYKHTRGNISYFFFSFRFSKRKKSPPGGRGPVDTHGMHPPPRARAIYNNVKLRPGRIRRPPDVAEHQLRGRWLSIKRSSFHFAFILYIFSVDGGGKYRS